MTNDIMLNICEEDLLRNEVELILTTVLFCKPNKWDSKSFNKALKRDLGTDYNIKQIVIGLFINTEEDVAPHYVVGLKVAKNFNSCIELVKKSLYTEFRKHTYFEFADLNEENELFRTLETQGEYIIDRLKRHAHKRDTKQGAVYSIEPRLK